jgi:DmsE family decaheme c-type cytochrome
MNTLKNLLCAVLLLAGLTWQQPAAAQAGAAAAVQAQDLAYSKEGADTCLGCHDDETATYSASALFKTPHGQRGNKHAPFGAGGLQCEACHGPGATHAKNKKAGSINTFQSDSKFMLKQRNDTCMGCHNGMARTAWHAGAHERGNVACTDCHKIHRERDAVLSKATEADVCLACHKGQRADFHKPSTHPVRTGLMSCSGCHSSHGSSAPSMLIKPTLNQTCTSCHADKRGPVLWEHAPVAEDCSLCHSAHGSVRAALLTKSPPLLCQQCHSPAGHPSVARTGAGLPGNGGGGSVFLVGSSCVNCHSQVHGSNHPSGAKLMR